MNENPGGTPNPLNPSPATPQPEVPQASTEQTAAEQPNVSQPSFEQSSVASPVEQGSMEQSPAGQPAVTAAGAAPVDTLDPTGRVMETALESPVEPPKKKKTGLIVGIIIAIIALIGGGVAAALVIMSMNKGDAVTAAMNKLMSEDAPTNVAIDGTIDLLTNDANSPISRVGITLDSGIIMGSNINSSTAVVTVTDSSSNNYSIEFAEVYAANGDLYFKVEGATAALEDLQNLLTAQSYPLVYEEVDYDGSGMMEDFEVTDLDDIPLTDMDPDDMLTSDELVDILDSDYCGYDDTDCLPTNSGLLGVWGDSVLSIIELVDGTWIRVSTEDLGMMTNGLLTDSPISCVSDFVNDINSNSNSAIELYNKYPFYTSSTENITLSSKANPVYRLILDNENFANFVNSMNNSVLSSNLYSCLGWEGNISITAEDVASVTAMLPEMYVEVDTNNNFTRFYAKTTMDTGAEMIVDLSFAYPASINVAEPNEYVDFSEIIQEIMLSMFDLSGLQIDEETVILSE